MKSKTKRRLKRAAHKAENRAKNVRVQAVATIIGVFCDKCGKPASRCFAAENDLPGREDEFSYMSGKLVWNRIRAACPPHSGQFDRRDWSEISLDEYVAISVQSS